MLDRAENLNMYEQLHHFKLGDLDTYAKSFPSHRSQFDFVVAAGLFTEQHHLSATLDEILYSLKAGGFAIFTVSDDVLDNSDFQEAIDN